MILMNLNSANIAWDRSPMDHAFSLDQSKILLLDKELNKISYAQTVKNTGRSLGHKGLLENEH